MFYYLEYYSEHHWVSSLKMVVDMISFIDNVTLISWFWLRWFFLERCMIHCRYMTQISLMEHIKDKSLGVSMRLSGHIVKAFEKKSNMNFKNTLSLKDYKYHKCYVVKVNIFLWEFFCIKIQEIWTKWVGLFKTNFSVLYQY